MRLSSVPVVALCMSMFSAVLCAADVPGSSDLQILPRLADTEIVDYRPAAEL